MPGNYEHWPAQPRIPYEKKDVSNRAATGPKGFFSQQQRKLSELRSAKRLGQLRAAYPSTPVFANERDVNWLDFENIPADGFFWAADAAKAGHALKAWNKMVRMKGIFQAKVPSGQYDFNMSYIAVGPAGNYITHSHATPEFYYILGGETGWIVEGQRYIAKAGNLYIHSPYMNHEMRGLKEGLPEVAITGCWSPFGNREVFEQALLFTEALRQQDSVSAITEGFSFHDFKLKKDLEFQAAP